MTKISCKDLADLGKAAEAALGRGLTIQQIIAEVAKLDKKDVDASPGPGLWTRDVYDRYCCVSRKKSVPSVSTST
ncbi:MAG: hypothetical protein RLZZ342_685 [Candidatus Parcubacteria bacterium]|jgi:hypothetical protein